MLESQSSHSLQCSNCKGIAIPLLLILLPTLLYLAALALNTSFSVLLQREAQAGVDASSLSGALFLNGRLPGWKASRQAAVGAVQKVLIHDRIGKAEYVENLLTLNANDKISVGALSVDKTSWTNGEVTVVIKRGRWLRKDGLLQFLSMEDEDFAGSWQGDPSQRGIPKMLAANAVQVSISLSVPTVFLSPGGGIDHSVSKTAVGTSSAVGPVAIAPFAIPACALVDDYVGDILKTNAFYPQSTMCSGERYFTGVQHLGIQAIAYYGFSTPLDITPEFHYRVNDRNDINGHPPSHVCNWGIPVEPRPADHFGVIGLAGTTTPDEQSIADLFENGDGLQTDVMIGDSFRLLEGPLTQPATDSLIWNRIYPSSIVDGSTASDSFTSGSHATLSSTDLRAHIPMTSLSWKEGFANTCVGSFGRTYGVCNSHRFGERSVNGTCQIGFEPDYVCPNGNCNDGLVWRVLLPVIADPSAPNSCCGVKAPMDNNDYEITADRNYQVIGFVPATIFDVDIGVMPPAYPTGCEPNAASFAKMPWGFAPNDAGTPSPCNLVRGRIDCDTPRLSYSSDIEKSPTPVLVE